MPQHLADDADGLVQRVRHVGAVHGDGLAVDLVGPAGEVAEVVDGQRHIRGAAVEDRLAVVLRADEVNMDIGAIKRVKTCRWCVWIQSTPNV